MHSDILRIEILHSAKCSSWSKMEELLRQVLEELKVPYQITTREIRDRKEAEKFGFLGSPTVKVNGQDLEPQPASKAIHLA